MQLYGSTRKDRGCCPGHDKFPSEKYNNRHSIKAHRRDTKIAHRIARRRVRRILRMVIKTGKEA